MILSTRKLQPGEYAVLLDKRETELLIVKGDPPKYRQPQMWDVLRGGTFLFSAKGKDDALASIDLVLHGLGLK